MYFIVKKKPFSLVRDHIYPPSLEISDSNSQNYRSTSGHNREYFKPLGGKMFRRYPK